MFLSILIVLLFVWGVWSIGCFFGIWGVVPLADVYYEGSVKINNAWIADWAEPVMFERIRTQPLIEIGEEDLIRRMIEQEVDGVRYNVSFGRLAESMREKSQDTSCIAAIHLGVRLPIFQVGRRWIAAPSVTAASRERWMASVYDKYLGHMEISSPYSAKIIFFTQTGSLARAELNAVECGCLATLTSITRKNGESLFS